MLILISCAGRQQRTVLPTFNTTSTNAGAGAVTGALIGGVGSLGFPPGILIGSAVGTIVGYDMQKRESKYLQQLDSLKSAGLKLTQMGDEITIHIPAARFFYGNSPRLKPKAFQVLQEIKDFVDQFPIHVIEVAGYTNDSGSRLRNIALSRSRADIIVDSFNRLGINTRLLYAKGYGEIMPLVKNRTPKGYIDNNRIEIILNPHTFWYGGGTA